MYNEVMILYIDETENNEYFVVTGLLAESEKITNDAYYYFKKRVNGYKISPKLKGKVFTEFKSILIDEQFQSIKKKMLEIIRTVDGVIIYSAYIKKTNHIKQSLKQKVYLRLLKNIVSSIDEEVDIIFDEFQLPIFEENIMKAIIEMPNVKSIMPGDSQLIPGLQFADNLCSVVRMKLVDEDKNDFYSIIQDLVKQAKIEQ